MNTRIGHAECRGLEKALDRMRAAWHGLEFRVLDFKDTGTYVLGGIDDVQACNPLKCWASRAPLCSPKTFKKESASTLFRDLSRS